jgi:uncharacterized cupin superfamily protein
MPKTIQNIDDLEYMEFGNGGRFETRMALLGARMGSIGLGYNITSVQPGKRAFPLHNHRVNDEMFFILAGSGEIRIGDERHPIRQGDIIACPPGGPESAHQIINISDQELRYLAVSTTRSPEVVEYPDSGKCGVTIEQGIRENGLPDFWRLMVKMDDTKVDYWEGED